MGKLKKLFTVLLLVTLSITLTACANETENDKEIKSLMEQYQSLETLDDVTSLQKTNIELYQTLENKEADSQSLEKKRIQLLDDLYNDNLLIDSLIAIQEHEASENARPSVEMVAEIINLENIDRLDKAKSLLDLEKYSTPEYIKAALDTAARINLRLAYPLDELKSMAAEPIVTAYQNVEKAGPVSESISDILIEWSKSLESNITDGDTKIKEAGMNFIKLFEAKTGNSATESNTVKFVSGGLTNTIATQEIEYDASVDNKTRMDYSAEQSQPSMISNSISFMYTSSDLSEKIGSDYRSINNGGIQSAVMNYDGKTYDIKETDAFSLLEVNGSTVTLSVHPEITVNYNSDTLIEFFNSSDASKSIDITFKDNKKITIPSKLFSNEIGKSASDYAVTILTYNK